MSDVNQTVTQGSANFPPVTPVTTPQQSQKAFFPFAAFSFDDPNKTNPPNLRLKDPWIFNADTIADTAANLASSNPTPMKGQIAYETDTKYFKLGDGSTAYNSLSYQSQYGKVAPLPQSTSGVGQDDEIISTSGGALSLPAGGTWLWHLDLVAASGVIQVFSFTIANCFGISAGGTQISAGVASYYSRAKIWRIA